MGKTSMLQVRLALVLIMSMILGPAWAGINSKVVVNVDPGNTKRTGQVFSYILSYSCSLTSGDCVGGQITDVLPPEVVFVEALGTSDVDSISAPSVGTNGTVTFNMISPLPAGNSGDLQINVRFPVGITPDGTVASNTATSTNMGTPTSAGPVDVTAVADVSTVLSKTLLTNPSYLDHETSYRLRVANNGELNISSLNVVDTLPLGDINPNTPVFLGATPAATCEPGCVGTKLSAPYELQWTGLSVNAGQNRDIQVRVRYESADFTPNSNVTNSFTADGVPLGATNSQNFGTGDATHTVVTFVPDPTPAFDKSVGGPVPAAISTVPDNGQEFYYYMYPRNSGNVDLFNMVVEDTLPAGVALTVTDITTGSYNGLSDYAAGVGVRVEYERSDQVGTWILLGTSPDTSTNSHLAPPALPANVYISKIRWLYGTAVPGMAPSSWGNRPRIYARIYNPDAAGNPVSVGDLVHNCADLFSEYPSGTALTPQNDCADFNVSGPYVYFQPDKTDMTNSGPYFAGDTINWRLRARLHSYSSQDLPLNQLVLTDLLPVDLIYAGNQTFDAGTAGVPAPDVFEQIDNYQNTGRTLLRWTWTSAGDFPRNSYADIRYDTTVRNGAPLGSLGNTFGMQHNAPIGQRCSGSPISDVLDMDNDGDTTDMRCTRNRTVNVQAVAQLISSKTVKASCDANFGSSSNGQLPGGAFQYKIDVTNIGTVPMENFTLIDILPFVGDTGVVDTLPRGSQWTPSLVAPIAAPSGVTVSYSTSGNPCRGEVGGPTSGCDAPNWSTVPPTPISDVRSVKFEFTGPPAISYDKREMILNMKAPAGINSGEFAYNSFAWRAYRSDLGTPLGAEPNKVGTDLGACTGASLGDFVWIDTNGDGIQNDGPTGLNNVQMFLYGPGMDGVPGTFDDVQLGTTLTSMGPGGQSGWYSFPGLSAGDYYVCMDAPATYSITGPNLGGDPALDSNINPATSCSGLVTLAVNEDNPTIDAGLVPTGTASLGNYVWFDYNGDGIQNEAPFDGVNGVTVELYVDNGDGSPGAGDTLVATQATADDANGFPGYYRFDGLAPGVPYYVKFSVPASASGFTSRDQGGDDTVDSDANTVSGYGHIVTLVAGEYDPSHDAGITLPQGGLLLGNQVWLETDNDGIFEPQNGETGINGVRLSLYKDVNGDGVPSINEYAGATFTVTANGLDGRYEFGALDGDDYIVVVDLSNFSGSGALAGLQTCTGNDPAPDPDNDFNGDDNGTYIGAVLGSLPVQLTPNGEPITDGDSDNNTNLSVDFCFTSTPVTVPAYDYGDNPDVLSGSGVLEYQTTALDMGASHQLGAASPFLGDCVDADNGAFQDAASLADDSSQFGVTHGACATAGDDEDGVSFSSTSLQPGDPLSVNIVVGAGSPADCNVSGWIDWNRDGVFAAGEQIVNSQAVAAGGAPAVINTAVPAGLAPGHVYARFRCTSSAGAISPVGSLADGEVEDYRLDILGEDWGDLPDSYATSTGANGPSHQVDPGNPLMLGSCVDTEVDGQPGAGADGDDLTQGSSTVGLCADDEDGVVFVNGSELFACQTNDISVTANRNALVDAWVDFDGDGTFGPGERVFSSQPVNAGVNNLQIDVPCNAAAGTSYARFRLTSGGVQSPDGPAADGEVEDYQVTINGFDMGDAAASYPVDIASNGAVHGVAASNPMYLGSCVDTELDGQPSAGADGDDSNAGTAVVGTCQNNDDEDGVTFDSPIAACLATNITVTANVAGVLDAWMDFDADGSWSSSEQIFSGQTLSAGANSLSFTVPCNAALGDTQLRFRFSSAGVSTPDGAAPDGEVEDYAVTVMSTDLGDLPDSYGTLLASNGAVHAFDASSTLYLGSCVDGEHDGAPGATDNGDDAATGTPVAGVCSGGDDEDGVLFVQPWVAGNNTDITITASAAGMLDAWADFNGDGDFADSGERIAAGVNLAAGSNLLTVAVPAGAIPGNIHTRFRLSSAGVAGPTGIAPDGEVEDHLVSLILSTDLMLEKAVSLTTDADGSGGYTLGDVVTFTLTLTNQGPNNATGVDVQDVVPDGYSNVTNISGGGILTGGNTINWLGLSVNNGQAMQLTFDATLTGTGNYTNVAQVMDADQDDPDSTPGNDDGDQSEDDEANVTPSVDPVIDLSLVKSVSLTTDADGSGSVTAGDTVTFTLALANAGPANATGVAVRDTVPSGFSGISAISNGGVLSGSVVDWSGLTVGAGSSLNLTFNAIVGNSGSYTNVAEVTAANEFDIDSTPNNDDGDQSEDDESNVVLNVGATIDLQLQKTISNNAPQVGDVVTFTLVLANTGLDTATGVSVADAVPAGYGNIANISNGGSLSGSTITWSGMTVPVGSPVTLSFDATVLPAGPYRNTAQVTAANEFDIDSNPNNDDGDQSEDDEDFAEPGVQQVIDLSLVKTVAMSNDADGSGDYTPGDTVHFSIVVSNAGPNAATGVAVMDVVPNGFSGIGNISNGGSLSGSTITWTGLQVPVNGSLSIGFDAVIELNGSHVNVAEVVGADQIDSDSTPGNGDPGEDDQDEAQLTPSDVIDLSLEKTVSGGPVYAVGDVVTFTLTVSNAGPSTATGIVVTDPVPAGFYDITAISNGGVLTGNTIVWSGLSLQAGASLPLTFQAAIAPGLHTNIAEITGANEFDPDSTPGNNDPGEDDYGSVDLSLKPPQPVPTVSFWMLILISLMLGLMGSIYRKRRNN
ncbi:GEVED domain-containing protein [Thiolapillus sp.]